MPVAMEKQVMILYAAINNLLDDVPLAKMREFEAGLYKFMDAGHPEVGNSIAREKDLNPATSEALKGAIQEFKQTFK
jgi:F-type H+-transporting ATPase subunit alpha